MRGPAYMTRIAPEALSCDPVGVDELSRLGVTLCGLGGLGVEVVDRLHNRFHGRPERIGLHPLFVDSVRADGYAKPSGPFALSFSLAESRFLASEADYAVVLEDIAAGNPPDWPLSITAAEARLILADKLPRMIGFGGQPVSSYVAANLGWPGWEQRVDKNLRAARAVAPGAEALTVVIASLYGGTGIGHLPLFLDKLKELGAGNVAVFVALPSQAEGLLQPGQVPDAHARGIAGLRGLLRPGLYKHLFLVGSGNRVLSRNPRGSAIEVIASTIAAWLENPAAFRSEQATWLGQDFQGATTAERLSALGAAEVVFPAEALARQQSCEHAAQAWQMVIEIGRDELNRATDDGEQFAWSNPMTEQLNKVTRTPPETSEVALFDHPEVVHGQARKMFNWFSASLPDTEPIEPRGAQSALEGQQRTMMSMDLVRLVEAIVRSDTEYVRDSVAKARARNLTLFTTMVQDELNQQFGAKDGVRLADRPWVLRRAVEFMGAAAHHLESTSQRIRVDLARVHEQSEPLRKAREAVESAQRELPPEIRTRGWRGCSPQVRNYLDAVDAQFDATILDLTLVQLADQLARLAAVCHAHASPLSEQISDLMEHHQACVAATSAFAEHLRHLRAQPTLIVVPDASPSLDALTQELARAASSDVMPDFARALLSRIVVRLEYRASDQPAHPVLWRKPTPDSPDAVRWRRTASSEATEALSSDGTVSLTASSYLPVLAYFLLQPHYASCTLADALAADYAYGWVPGEGGHADRALIKRFLSDKVISPLLAAGGSTVELIGAAEKDQLTWRTSVHLDQRPARKLVCVADGTAELVAGVMTQTLREASIQVTPGAPGRATMTTVVNRVPWHRVVEFGGKVMVNYRRGTRLPVHLDRASLEAYKIERAARAAGYLRGRDRILDPDVTLLLEDPEALWGFLNLVATGRMPMHNPDPLDPSAHFYRIDLERPGRVRSPQWRHLGPVNDPLAALRELFHNEDSARLRRSVVETWQQAAAKLVIDCRNDQQRAQDMLKIALRDLVLPEGDSGQRFAADVGLLIKVRLDDL